MLHSARMEREWSFYTPPTSRFGLAIIAQSLSSMRACKRSSIFHRCHLMRRPLARSSYRPTRTSSPSAQCQTRRARYSHADISMVAMSPVHLSRMRSPQFLRHSITSESSAKTLQVLYVSSPQLTARKHSWKARSNFPWRAQRSRSGMVRSKTSPSASQRAVFCTSCPTTSP